jgi:glycerate kinase
VELDGARATVGGAIERARGRLVADLPGAGAAGGTTAGLMGFTGATIRPGIEIVAELVGLATALEDADLVITGEGRADEQTLQGKTAMGVATLARPRSTPVVLLCGALGSGADAVEASGAFSLVQPIGDRPATLEDAIDDSARLLANAAARVARGIGIGLEIGPSA